MKDDADVGRELVLDELLDLTLYRELQRGARGDMARILGEMVEVETRHLAFWIRFFGWEPRGLDWRRRLKLCVLKGICALFGEPAARLVVEAIEIYGVRKYLEIRDRWEGTPLGDAVKEILNDELGHENAIVSRDGGPAVGPERVRGFFLGFNDGLVEILGAVGGFFVSLQSTPAVLAAGVCVAAAGAFSMAAGAFAAANSEREVRALERDKARYLGLPQAEAFQTGSAAAVGALVGLAYLLGATVPLLPVALGARNAAWPLAVGALLSVAVSVVLSFLSGMRTARRVVMNLAIVAAAFVFSSVVGWIVKALLGVQL